ncbi:cation:proton antiporter [Parapedobacter sp. ISTM3]|uniref:Multicomponent Na+:H+ antiporter subunit F n=1 Tax=Parapedobacter luteus TaxID=623280 RepID=A0A1T5BWV4_9SPHI|nr:MULTISPECIES: cation:proton antiporter [Parapedobacter]MBK1442313.1 cation:proton antiporter [Parapedobacter sp. ISTM3]SKB51589.1 multicomponent Na+:H+ antiporter subunit F [Parapedobacter luteus]
MTLSTYIDYVILPILGVALLLVLVRIFKGPTIVDRVIALDLLITIGVGVITVFSISTQKSTFIDVAMILALIAFLGTIAFSYYLEKRGRK